MSQGRPDLTPYQVAYLAGGPARVAETATVELLRRRQLRVGPTGLLSRAPAGVQDPPDGAAAGHSPGGAAADFSPGGAAAGHGIEQLILQLGSMPGGLYLPSMRRRCFSWRPVAQIGSQLAAAGLTIARGQRRLALAAALVLLAAGAAISAAIAGGWQAFPTARSPLAVAGAIVVAGLLVRAGKRTTSDGRQELQDTAQLTRQMLAQLQAVTLPVAMAAAAAADSATLTAEDVANVALSGLEAVRDPELRARLGKPAPRGRRNRAAPTADESLAANLGTFTGGL
jgi:uncharacterized protein (TIGR04222 family)